MDKVTFEKIIHDIRNMKQLTKSQKDAIPSLTNEQKTKIIYIYDEIISYSLELLNETLSSETNNYK
jgi:hypothetical protein